MRDAGTTTTRTNCTSCCCIARFEHFARRVIPGLRLPVFSCVSKQPYHSVPIVLPLPHSSWSRALASRTSEALSDGTTDILLILIAILFPPAAAGIITGCSCEFMRMVNR